MASNERPVSLPCAVCGEAFAVSRMGPVSTACPPCRKERAKQRSRDWYVSHPERGRTRAKRWNETNKDKRWSIYRKSQLKQYGLSPEQYEELVEQQDGRCAICYRTPQEANPSRRPYLVVDHCHATDTVRALLCEPCNHGLGKFGDNPTVCRNAATYLEQYSGELLDVSAEN